MHEYDYMYKPATVVDFGLTPEQEAQAKRLHEEIIVFDGLMECTWYDNFINIAKSGGTTAGCLSLGITDMHGWQRGDTFLTERWWSWDALVNDLTSLGDIVRKHPDDLMICLNADDIHQAKETGKIGLMPGVQNSHFLDRDLSRLNKSYNMGLRIVQLTYNKANLVGSGCMEKEEAQFGLSRFGEEVVGRMNELGMLIDTGHCSTATLMAAVEVSDKPISCTHAGIRSMVNQPRSHTDEALKKLADNGGVFGLISAPGALTGKQRCSVHDYLDNIDYAVNHMGVEHVGLGTDFVLPSSMEQILAGPDWGEVEREAVGVYVSVWPWSDGHEGMENNSGYPNLTRGLVARGYSYEDITRIMGGNWLRLIEEVI